MRILELFEPDHEIDEAVIDDPELDDVIDKADAGLDDHGGRAIDAFVGGPHDAMKRGQEFGIMIRDRLEDAYSSHPSKHYSIRQQLEKAIVPVRNALKAKYGKTIKLYRGQSEIDKDATHRNVLSWTNDYEVAAAFVDAYQKVRKPLTDDEIAQLYKTYNETGKVKYGQHVFVRMERPVFDDPEAARIFGNNPDYYEIQDRHGEVATDGDDLVAELKSEQEWEIEQYKKHEKKLQRIKTADVDIDAIVWITNRFGQSEFIVRNIPGSPWYISHLKESFNPKSANIKPYQDDTGLSGHTFTVDGREFFVGFQGGNGDYYMSFTGEDDRGSQSAMLLGHNKPMAVFNHVLASIINFIKHNQPNIIEFSVDDREEQRVSTYDKLLDHAEKNGLIPKGYMWDRDGNNNYFIFKDGYR